MRTKVTLPREDSHVPEDGRIPDGMGAKVWLGTDGPVIGEVVGWRDLGNGRAVVELEYELPAWFTSGTLRSQDDLSFGLDAVVGQNGDGGVASIAEIVGVIVTADGGGR